MSTVVVSTQPAVPYSVQYSGTLAHHIISTVHATDSDINRTFVNDFALLLTLTATQINMWYQGNTNTFNQTIAVKDDKPPVYMDGADTSPTFQCKSEFDIFDASPGTANFQEITVMGWQHHWYSDAWI